MNGTLAHYKELLLPLALTAAAAVSALAEPSPLEKELLRDAIPKWEKLHPVREARIDRPKKVTARKGPVEITLKVANTRVRRQHGRYSLWIQATLKNVGKKPFELWEQEFYRSLLSLSDDTATFHFEILTEDGKPVGRTRLGGTSAPNACGPIPKDPWWDDRQSVILEPGMSLSSPDSSYASAVELACLKRPQRSPIPPYGEIYPLQFGDAKRAKIRLVWRKDLPPERRMSGPRRPEEVNVATEWIPLEILS